MAFTPSVDIGTLQELFDNHGADAGKKGSEYLTDALAGEVSGKRAKKAIDACEEAVTLSKKVLEGSVPISEVGGGKSWWGKIKGQMFGESVSTEKVRQLAKELQELKADQAAGITGLEAKIAKKSEKFLEEAKKVLPTLPHFQQSASKALAVVEQQEVKAKRAADKAIKAWADAEKETLKGTFHTQVLADDKAKVIASGKSSDLHDFVPAGGGGAADATVKSGKKFDKALDHAAEKVFKKDHRKDFDAHIKDQRKAIHKDIESKYKAQKKNFKGIEKTSAKTIAGIEEETGLKATEMASTKGKEALAAGGNKEAAAALKAEKNMLGGSIRGNLSKGMWGITKVGVGAVGVFDGVRRVWKGFSPGQDEQGNPKAMDPFQIAIGAGETALGAFVAGHGGHVK